VALAIQPAPMHQCVRVTPSDSAAGVVQACQGSTAFPLRPEFPRVLTLPSMWTCSYGANTAEHVSQQTIQCYIAAQTGR
jgi:putative transposase